DFNILPGLIDFSVHDVKLDTRITRNIRIKAPLGIIAHGHSDRERNGDRDGALHGKLYGGVGIIHGNFPKPEDQAAEVLKV
ncbi:hypothetical protein OSTOST_15202, partial [Ostertagia ostertagi]